jgi:hypothetical protein
VCVCGYAAVCKDLTACVVLRWCNTAVDAVVDAAVDAEPITMAVVQQCQSM